MNNLRVVFDKVSHLLSLSDSLEQDECRIVITYPDEIVQDLGKVLKESNNWAVSIPSRTDLFGNFMEGTYSFLFERYDVGGTTPTSTDTGSFELSVSSPVPVVTVTDDVFTPILRLTDSTDWSNIVIDGEWTIDTLARLWNASSGPHYFGPGAQPTLNLYDSGYWTGDYEYTFSATTGYDHSNGWVSTRLYVETSGSFTINEPVMLPELAALFNCLWGKITAKNCCKDASYDQMVADYQLAIAMSQNFILNGQAGITGTIQNDLLFGSDCTKGILAILAKWGCEDATIEDTLIINYDWCLCDTGGGGVVTDREGYQAGTGCFITSDATDDGDRWTFAVASGIGTFTQNLAGSRIFGGTVRGDNSTATHTSNGATNSFKLTLPIPGDLANEGYASALLANVTVWSAPASNPTASAPWVLDEGSVQKRIVDIGSDTVSFVFAGIGATYSSGWAITFETP